jgi:integrase
LLDEGGGMFISRKSIKTHSEYEVEINRYIYEILEKNNFRMNLLSHQKANMYIKNFLKKIPDFNEETIFTNNSVSPPIKYKIYELTTFHQGRRSFITNLIDQGIPISEIKEITDHKRVGTIEKYISRKSRNKKRRLFLYEDETNKND